MNKEILPVALLELINEEEIMMFKKLRIKIKELNFKTNLTRLIEGDEFWISQVFDSISPFRILPNINFDNKKFLDIGSGCGFPGFAYAITHPNSEIYLIDSSKKKTDALKAIVDQIEFKNKIYVINDRIENIAHLPSLRNKFDIATTRAVSNPSTVSEYILPMLKKDGYGILYCGKWNDENTKALTKTLKTLNGVIKEKRSLLLPKHKGIRNIIFIQPKLACPKIYPRKVGKPAKNPL